MRIACPHCGLRDVQEFSYLGGVATKRPEGAAASEAAMFDHVYLRDNPAGRLREHWHHAAGCRAWLVVTRDTRTHEIFAVEAAASGASA